MECILIRLCKRKEDYEYEILQLLRLQDGLRQMMIEDISILLQILLMPTDIGLELTQESLLFYWEPIIEEGDLLPKIVDQRT